MKTKKFLGVLLAALILLSVFPLSTNAYSKEQATLTFSDSGVTETVSGSGYNISGNTLTITDSGTYRVTGSCSEGNITVGKELTGVTLILDDLSLTSATTAPIIVKKGSSVLLKLEGESTLTDNEDASTEATNSDFEGAAIKVKSGSNLTIFGDGILNAVGNAKNAIKGASESSLTVDGGTINVSAVNNGIAFDGSVVINAGVFSVTSDNDGIKSQPDEGDTASAGTVTINGGTFNINAKGDGIVAAEKLTINNGTFDIKTLDGSQSSSFNKDTMSCKGLKASSNNVADAENPTTSIIISGGTFNLNTADDAIHSDGYVTITGGTFDIYTGDDGVHADVTLTLGTENGYDRDPEITINSSYEGLEGAVVNIYSGKYYVNASDDGINAAGGSSNGTQGQQGQDPFTPPQPGQGGPGQGGFNPGGQQSSGDNSYSINVYGGNIYVNCTGDGLDSNGSLNLLGGDITVLSMQGGGDNSPLDAEGTITINGATVFAAGSRGMGVNLSNSSQSAYTSTSSYSAGKVINVTSSGTILRSEKLVRNISYLLYSQPDLGSCSVSTASVVDSCKSNAFAHNWDNGTAENGVIKYTCSDCSAVEYKTIPSASVVTEYVEEETTEVPTQESSASETTEPEQTSEPETDKGYTVNFVTDGNATVNVYYTQDYSSVSETSVSSAVSRNSKTGDPDTTGDGQVNFTVIPAEGYEVESVSVTPTSNYKNIKDQSATLANTYRVTKITGEITITVTTKAKESSDPATAEPTTEAPVTEEPTTAEPTTEAPATEEPTTAEPTTEAPATEEPTTAEPTTEAPTTAEPTTAAPTTKPVSLTYTRKSIKAAGVFTLKVKNAGSAKISYQSSNKKVATVTSKGVVTGLRRGTAIITVTVGSKKLTCKVTVTNNPVIKIGSKSVSAKKTYTIKEGKTLTLKLYRRVSSIKNTYASSKKSVAKVISKAKVDKVVIKGLKKGKATITIKLNGVRTFKIKVKVVKK